MRRLYRPTLPLDLRVELYRRSKAVISKEEGRKCWNKFRRAKVSADVLSTLSQMSGKRARCFYCGDSIGADVDHYLPIALNYSLTFSWKNWLLVCPNCNRHKSDSFPVDKSGMPLLLDPSTRDPWKHVILDVNTGLIAPRWGEDESDPIGEATLRVLSCLLDESIAEGRLRVVRRLRRAVTDFLNREEKGEAWQRLLQEVAEDDYGVSLWVFAWEGAQKNPFSSFKLEYPYLNRRLISFAMRWPYQHKIRTVDFVNFE